MAPPQPADRDLRVVPRGVPLRGRAGASDVLVPDCSSPPSSSPSSCPVYRREQGQFAKVVERRADRAHGLGVRFLFDSSDASSRRQSRASRRAADAWGLRDIDLASARARASRSSGRAASGKTTLLRTSPASSPGRRHAPGRGARRRAALGRGGPARRADRARERAAARRARGPLASREATPARRASGRSRLGDAFDRPVSSYSQGMRARLGFATARRGRADDPAPRRGARGARPRVPRDRPERARTILSQAASSSPRGTITHCSSSSRGRASGSARADSRRGASIRASRVSRRGSGTPRP